MESDRVTRNWKEDDMAYVFRREPLTAEEADRLQAACRTAEERLGIWALLDTGLRVHELAGLERDRVEWQQRRVSLIGKGRKRRVVPLTDRVLRLLEHFYALSDRLPFSVRGLQRMVKRVAGRAGIARLVTPHSLRHTYAVRCVQRGISTRALQLLLGHSSLAVTEIYLNLSPEAVLAEWRAKW